MVEHNITVKSFRTKPVTVSAVQFDGKNSRAIAQWVRDGGEQATAGGSYIRVITHDQSSTARKGDWIVRRPDGEFEIFTEEELYKDFTELKKKS